MSNGDVFIGHKPTNTYVLTAILEMAKVGGHGPIFLKARGRAINHAVDVSEILKSQLAYQVVSLKTATEELDDHGTKTRVSSISIEMKC